VHIYRRSGHPNGHAEIVGRRSQKTGDVLSSSFVSSFVSTDFPVDWDGTLLLNHVRERGLRIAPAGGLPRPDISAVTPTTPILTSPFLDIGG
jgi:hypothetical protein